MPTRTARTAWNGGLEDGSGQVELSSSKVGTYDVSFPKRTAEDAGGTTSPEELIAAAHSACYAMQFSAVLGEAGGTVEALDVKADVSLGPDPAGGFRLTGIVLTVSGEVSGIDEAAFLNADERGPHTPGPTAEAVAHLIERGIVGWGSQCIGTDAGQAGGMDPPFPAHNLLHKAGRYGLASLANLERLPPKGAVLIAAPLKIENGTGSPIRALALVARR